eukprot:3358617-Pyramimonas_sp.AAC.1
MWLSPLRRAQSSTKFATDCQDPAIKTIRGVDVQGSAFWHDLGSSGRSSQVDPRRRIPRHGVLAQGRVSRQLSSNVTLPAMNKGPMKREVVGMAYCNIVDVSWVYTDSPPPPPAPPPPTPPPPLPDCRQAQSKCRARRG